MKTREYDRISAIEYARKWAYGRNIRYYNFDKIGGDCTSFISQCLYEGSKVMNYTKYLGWYYNSINDRTASWSGVEFLYNFLIGKHELGPIGEKGDLKNIEIGDIVQFKFENKKVFSHSAIIVNKDSNNLKDIHVATHTYDVYFKSIAKYIFDDIRFIHIKKVGYM